MFLISYSIKRRRLFESATVSHSYILICIRESFITARTLFLSKLKEQAKTKSRLNHLSHNERRALLKNLDRINSQICNFTLPSLPYTLLFGNPCLNGETNTQILDATIDYILSKKLLSKHYYIKKPLFQTSDKFVTFFFSKFHQKF